jgi:hypothetical protein
MLLFSGEFVAAHGGDIDPFPQFPCGKALPLEMKLKQVGGDRVMLLTDI